MNNIKIGWATRDITSDEPLNLPGQFHIRISEGVLDPVTLTALVTDNGEDLAIFLSADACVVRSGLLDEIRRRTAEKDPDIPVEKIIMNTTHTHEAPSHYDDFGWDAHERTDQLNAEYLQDPGVKIASSSEYKHFFAEQASDAVCEAYNQRNAGGIAYGFGFASTSHSRRVVYFDDLSLREKPQMKPINECSDIEERIDSLLRIFDNIDGNASMYGNTNDENFSHYEAGTDAFVDLMYTFDISGKLTGAIINIPCPSQNSELLYQISADFWNEVRNEIRKRYGDIFILPQCAAAGDLSPRVMHYKEAVSRRYRLKYGGGDTEMNTRADIAERISDCFGEVLIWADREIYTQLPIRHIVKTIHLSRRYVTDEEMSFCKNGLDKLNKLNYIKDMSPLENLRYNSTLATGRYRFEEVLARYEQQKQTGKIPMELHVLNIGDIAFASNRFELYMDYQHRIQSRSPFCQTFIIQLSGQPGRDGGSYLCTERAEKNRSYSASVFCNIVSPAGGQELVEETVALLEELALKNKN